MDSKKLKLNSGGGTAYFETIAPQSNIGIILVHGLAEHKGRYIEFINKLHSLNYSVFALDLPGHGESSGKRGDIQNFSEYEMILNTFISNLKKRFPQMKIGLFGHSLGGLISCCYASQHNDLDFLILSSPLLERKKLFNIFYFLPCKLGGFIKIKKRHSESKEMLAYSRNDPLACKYMTLRLLGEIFITGINYLSQRFDKITLPLLILGGSEDNLVKTKNFRKIIEAFGSRNKTLKIYDGVRHRLVHSARKEEVVTDISAWIKEQIEG